jgi:hypothetical protein
MSLNTNQKETSKWSKRKLFLFSSLTVLFLFLVLEIIFRVLFFFQYRNLHTNIFIQGSSLQISDSILIWKSNPLYVDYDRNYQNNEEGMKSNVGDEFIPNKTQIDFWVLLTGGSAMVGMGSNRNGEWLDITGVDNHPWNETIGFYLQQLLQKSMPQKKVKVFDAAESSYTVMQSYLRYITLSEKMKFDWVVSMDGVNDPAMLKNNETTLKNCTDEWYKNPQFHYPLKLIIPLTSHSALLNAVKQKLFHLKADYKLRKARNNDFPIRKYWANAKVPLLKYVPLSDDILRGANSFKNWILKYDSTLTVKGQKHLLLIQPHMCFRDTSMLGFTEKAVNKYYRSAYQDEYKHTFLKSICHFFSENNLYKNIVVMNSVHYWPGWVFVDYCHFTKEAEERIAAEIFNYISSDGKEEIFKR